MWNTEKEKSRLIPKFGSQHLEVWSCHHLPLRMGLLGDQDLSLGFRNFDTDYLQRTFYCEMFQTF